MDRGVVGEPREDLVDPRDRRRRPRLAPAEAVRGQRKAHRRAGRRSGRGRRSPIRAGRRLDERAERAGRSTVPQRITPNRFTLPERANNAGDLPRERPSPYRAARRRRILAWGLPRPRRWRSRPLGSAVPDHAQWIGLAGRPAPSDECRRTSPEWSNSLASSASVWVTRNSSRRPPGPTLSSRKAAGRFASTRPGPRWSPCRFGRSSARPKASWRMPRGRPAAARPRSGERRRAGPRRARFRASP
jgi:hypothetical protein